VRQLNNRSTDKASPWRGSSPHRPRALATIARFGGRVVAGGGKIDLLEGDPMPERIFIISDKADNRAGRGLSE